MPAGPASTTRNQQSGGGQWQLLGTFQLNAGTGGSVEVSDANAGGTVSADAARFVPASGSPALTVIRAGTGAGTVTSVPAGINCGTDYSQGYPSGTAINLSAAAAVGWRFVAWTGDADCADGVVTMTVNRSCTATFTSSDIVIDNGQPGTSFAGAWAVSSALSPFGANSIYGTGAATDTYRWTPTIPTLGTYQVYVWWTIYPNRSTSVSYTVRHAGGTVTTTRNSSSAGAGGSSSAPSSSTPGRAGPSRCRTPTPAGQSRRTPPGSSRRTSSSTTASPGGASRAPGWGRRDQPLRSELAVLEREWPRHV